MRNTFRQCALATMIGIVAASSALAQDVRVALQTVLARLAPGGILPSDMVLTGQLTDASGTQPFRITIKGKDRMKYEVGTGSALITMTLSRGAGWREASGHVDVLQPYSAMQRPAVVPFFDLLAEASNSNLQITDRGLFLIGTLTSRRYTLRLPDPTPEIRLFRRALDEEIDLYTDPVSLLVVRTERWRMAENSMDVRLRQVAEFSDYRNVTGLAVPFHVVETAVVSSRSQFRTTYDVDNVTVNAGVDDSIFVAKEPRR